MARPIRSWFWTSPKSGGEPCFPRVGGKAANLGELAMVGLPVPRGFCLTTAAYRQALSGVGLEPVLAALEEASASDTGASDTGASGMDQLNELAARARSLVLDAGGARWDRRSRTVCLRRFWGQRPCRGEVVGHCRGLAVR